MRPIVLVLAILAASPAAAQDVAAPPEVERTQIAVDGAPDPAIVHGWVADYFAGTRSGDARTWAAAFAEGAVVDDPVGTPVKDTPEAILAMGEGFLGAFEEVGLTETFVHVVGLEAVAPWEGRGTLPSGEEVTFRGVNQFTFDAEGGITLLRGFFAPPG